MTWLRWKIALIAYGIFLKALPDGHFKDDYLDAVTSLRLFYPRKRP